jgi:uncharacterized RDD family membrane protein YckC
MQTEYKIIGGDEVEYGPATLDELKAWIRDGRVARMTKVWRNDKAQWLPADNYAELGRELAQLHAAAALAAQPCGFWARLGAYIVDVLILGPVFQLIWIQSGMAQRWQMPVFPSEMTDASIQQFMQNCQTLAIHAVPIMYPLFFFYEVLLNGRFGATIGKMAIGARIVVWDGSRLGYGRAALRWIAARLSDMFFFAGYFLIILRKDKRALHDLLAGTRVIYKQ